MAEDNVTIVKHFLKAQNLEQVGRIEEAVELYERAVTEGFDATGPYDRLIHIYADQARHNEVVRVAESAITNVQTYDDKKAWYEQMRAAALKARVGGPKPAPKKPL